MKSINFQVSHQVEEVTHLRFNMGGREFYTEASRIPQVFRKTLLLKERGMLSPYITCVVPYCW